jgi:anaerobic selenocysteine-containing dehydrogenase
MDKQVGQQGPQACRINPIDAEARGISDRSQVRVFNDRSEILALARVTDSVIPGVVSMPMGHWSSPEYGEATVNALNSDRYADIGRAPTFSDTAVQVEAVPSGWTPSSK